MARTPVALAKLPMIAKIGVGAGALCLVGASYFVLFYGDIESSIKAAQGQEQVLRNGLAEARKNEFAYQKDLAEYTDRQHRQRELNKVLPVDTEYPSFLSAVQSVANVSGIGLTTGTVTGLSAGTYYFSVATRNSTGMASAASTPVAKTVP